jgi:ribonuclease HI
MSIINVYTDGACSGNPGPGGYGVVIEMPFGRTLLHSAYDPSTTNNRMELSGAIRALTVLASKYTDYDIIMHTDSKYVHDGITSWIKNWKKRGWRKADKSEVLNVDLWQQLDFLNSKLQVEWVWVKGHSTNAGNNKADELATTAIAMHKGVTQLC